ncbi:hypothetical protein Tco_1020037 [Tanacetum coccineum]|uniref:Xylulose kinase-1 n=1 Tax=Tanacetum coccineum TaxID=301880 RepID=A0ABQ5G143_9ASTR
MSTLKFAETHNLVAFLEKPEESNRFEGIVDFLNTSSIKYALTVNPTVYESCIKQFWASAKAKIVNGEHQIQALVDKKKVIITEKSVRSDLMLEDAKGTECLPNDIIFEQLTLMGAKTTAWNEFSNTMASAIICLATNQNFNFSKYIFDNMMKNLEGGVKFLMYPRFVQVFLDKQIEGMSKHKGIYVTPSYTKKIFANMKREGKGFSRRITPLLQTMMVQALEDIREDSAAPTDSRFSFPHPLILNKHHRKPLKRSAIRKQRKDNGPTEPIPDEPTNEEHVSTPSYDPSQSGEDRTATDRINEFIKEERNQELLASRDKEGEEVVAEKEVAEKEVSATDPVTTVGEVVTTANIKAAKPKAVTTAATTTTTTRPKARGVVVQEPSEFKSTSSPSQASQLPQAKDKGKAKMVDLEKPSKKKDQIALDKEVARNLKAQLQAELEEEERLARQKE